MPKDSLVKYQLDKSGELYRAWILTAEETARPDKYQPASVQGRPIEQVLPQYDPPRPQRFGEPPRYLPTRRPRHHELKARPPRADDAARLHPHVRLPDERVRLGQDGRRARRRRRLRALPTGPRTPTSSCSTPARCARRRRSGCSTISAGCARSSASGPDLIIGVGGCVASQEGAAIVARAPYVDVVFGPQTLHRLPELIAARRRDRRGRRSTSSFPEIEKFDHLPPPRVEGAAAFVSIMEGCSKYCTFCVVPYTRGEEVSRPFDDVLTEVADLADQGVMEVTLLGQNVNAYRGRMADGTLPEQARMGRPCARSSNTSPRFPASSASATRRRTRRS